MRKNKLAINSGKQKALTQIQKVEIIPPVIFDLKPAIRPKIIPNGKNRKTINSFFE